MKDLLNLVYPDLKVRVRRLYASMLAHHKLEMRCTQGLRTFAEQDVLYAQGRTQAGPLVTYARGGESFHNYGCAVDSCFVGSDPYLDKLPRGFLMWSEYGRFAEVWGLNWGGNFKHSPDRPHVELTYGLTLAEIQKLYDYGGITAVWMKFDKIRGVEPGEGWLKRELSVRK